MSASVEPSTDPSTSPSTGRPAPLGAPATWEVDPARPPGKESRSISALVTRLSCSGGKTGEVLPPVVREDDTRVVVTYTVEPLPDGAYTCQGNKPTPHTFTLQRPLANRALLDGECLTGKSAAMCPREQRWPLDG